MPFIRARRSQFCDIFHIMMCSNRLHACEIIASGALFARFVTVFRAGCIYFFNCLHVMSQSANHSHAFGVITLLALLTCFMPCIGTSRIQLCDFFQVVMCGDFLHAREHIASGAFGARFVTVHRASCVYFRNRLHVMPFGWNDTVLDCTTNTANTMFGTSCNTSCRLIFDPLTVSMRGMCRTIVYRYRFGVAIHSVGRKSRCQSAVCIYDIGFADFYGNIRRTSDIAFCFKGQLHKHSCLLIHWEDISLICNCCPSIAKRNYNCSGICTFRDNLICGKRRTFFTGQHVARIFRIFQSQEIRIIIQLRYRRFDTGICRNRNFYRKCFAGSHGWGGNPNRVR